MLDQFHQYEISLGQEQTDVPIVRTMEKKYSIRHQLWDSRQKFDDLKKRWYTENFKDQDAQQIEATVKKFNGEAFRIRNFEFPNGHTDDVCEALI